MNRVEAEENIKVIRDIMERSVRYTHFSGLSGIIAGMLALLGCAATIWVAWHNIWWWEIPSYIGIWVAVFVLAVAQDAFFAHLKAKRNGQSILNPATFLVIKAVLPGIILAMVTSIRALQLNELDAIPALWALGYGVAASAAGMFSVKEVRVFGLVQLLTGAVGLFLFSDWFASIYLLAVSFGLYHIIFGIWMWRRYGW